MRWILACLGTMLICIPSRSADPIEEIPEGPPISAADAQLYAQQLHAVITEVVDQYMNPVSRGDLAHAALKGLYEASRLPLPASLAADLHKTATDEEVLKTLAGAREKIGNPTTLQGQDALFLSIQAMLRILDPHSGVIGAEELTRGAGNDKHRGFGLEVNAATGVEALTIKSVAPGSPAQRAGLRPGDRITHLDGKAVEKIEDPIRWILPKVSETVKGAIVPASDGMAPAQLTVLRPGTKTPFKVKLEVQDFKRETVLGVTRNDDNSWDYLLDKENKIAQVRIATLASGGTEENGTADDLERILTSLEAQRLRGLILDLRWCPSGSLPESVAVAQLFVGNAKVVTVKGRGGKATEYQNVPARTFDGFPIVVLINGETTGAAELIAAALQDNKRAVLAGQRSLGKATIQTYRPLPIANAGIKLTSGIFVRPSGKNLHRFPQSTPADDWGVRPDPGREVRISPELNRQLREWWLLQTLRPGPAREVLPLDDPQSDPQRQAALQVLRGLIANAQVKRND